jgi:exopolysaccharide biosynthesis WecB/TagA/CpsF family protein
MLHSGAEASNMPARDILGVRVCDIARTDALEFVHGCVAARTWAPVTFLNAHNANIAFENGRFRETLDEFTVLSDGIGVDLASRLLYGAPFRDNLNGTDFVPDLLTSAPLPIKVGLFGARPGVADKAVDCFRQIDGRHDFRVVGHGYLGLGDDERVLETLAAWRPDILLVALGVPKQEFWIAENLDRRHCSVPIGVGALFDLTTGTVPRAPAWIRTLRGEWLYRLSREPGRLWRRYLIGNPLFIARVIRQRYSPKGAPSNA